MESGRIPSSSRVCEAPVSRRIFMGSGDVSPGSDTYPWEMKGLKVSNIPADTPTWLAMIPLVTTLRGPIVSLTVPETS